MGGGGGTTAQLQWGVQAPLSCPPTWSCSKRPGRKSQSPPSLIPHPTRPLPTAPSPPSPSLSKPPPLGVMELQGRFKCLLSCQMAAAGRGVSHAHTHTHTCTPFSFSVKEFARPAPCSSLSSPAGEAQVHLLHTERPSHSLWPG